MVEVKSTKKMGRGVYATQYIKAGTKVHTAEFIKLKDSELPMNGVLAKYAFTYSKKYSVIALGVGSLFNHSNMPTVEAYFAEHDGREVMEYWSTADIKAGEQLFISYGGEEYAFYNLLK